MIRPRHTTMTRQRSALLTGMVTAVLLAGCATQSTPAGGGGPPGTDRPAFAAFTITKTGGFAGVRQRIDVAPDGTVRDESGKVLGHIESTDLDELRTLLTGQEIRAEAGRGQPSGSKCADGFTFTLVMGDLRVSDYACGRPADKPTFKRVLELTSAGHLKN